MKFGKKTIALIGAVAMLSSVAACGSTSAGDSGSTGSSDKKIELTVWSWDSTLPRTVKGFEAKNPNIKVKVTNAGSIFASLGTRIVCGGWMNPTT